MMSVDSEVFRSECMKARQSHCHVHYRHDLDECAVAVCRAGRRTRW